MKKMLAMLILLCSLFITSSALATWNCYASSIYGQGSGFSDNKGIAATIALQECRYNTPYWDFCYLRYCYWY